MSPVPREVLGDPNNHQPRDLRWKLQEEEFPVRVRVDPSAVKPENVSSVTETGEKAGF